MGYRNLSISLPEQLVSLVELVQTREHRSRSEVMREALRLYFERRGLIEDPLPGEPESVREAGAEISRSEAVPVPQARLVADLQARLEQLPNVRLAVLYGSWARDAAGSRSDVDIALQLASGSLRERREIESELGEIARREVDVVYLDESPPLLRFEIARDGRPLIERTPDGWSSFKARAMLDWWEWAPTARKIQSLSCQRLTGSYAHDPA